jgi:hypothetical protein
MRGSTFIAFFGIATVISGALVGCGDDDGDDDLEPVNVAKSKEGESCVTTNDCDTGLACYSNVCLPGANGTGGSTSTGGTGGTSNPTLGGVGESCTRRADCSPGLGCYSQRCAETDTGEGGAGNVPVTQGSRGETCVLSSDCTSPLACLPGGSGGPGAGVGFVGVCSDVNTDVPPTGKVCGAECTQPVDCCQLPLELHETIGVKTCTELTDVLDGVTCDGTASVQDQARCLAQAAYCLGCDADTWECTGGLCVYALDCAADGLVPDGCPTVSRAGFGLPFLCDVGGSDRCQPPAGEPLCTTAADCDGLPVSDDGTDTCNADECICFESQCLRPCDSDLDCRVGFVCDMGDEVCVPEGSCTTDVTCQREGGDIRLACVDGVCTMPCQTDLDCNEDGLTDGGFEAVCNADHMCEPIGCADDSECPGAGNGVKLFCTTPADAVAARAAQSAITD